METDIQCVAQETCALSQQSTSYVFFCSSHFAVFGICSKTVLFVLFLFRIFSVCFFFFFLDTLSKSFSIFFIFLNKWQPCIAALSVCPLGFWTIFHIFLKIMIWNLIFRLFVNIGTAYKNMNGIGLLNPIKKTCPPVRLSVIELFP